MLSLPRNRRFSRGLAALLLAVWLVPIAAPHSGNDDDLCFPTEAAAGTSGIKAQAGVGQPPHHCLVCHSLRTYRTALTDCGPAATMLTAERVVVSRVPDSRRAAALDRLPARAPPA